VLEAGKKYKGTFFIDNEELKDKLFTGILKIETDNFLYIINDKNMPIEIYDYFNNVETRCNVVKEFCLKGTIGNNKITCSHTWNNNNYENRVVFKADEIFFGDTYLNTTAQVKNGSAVFSEFIFNSKETDNKYSIHVVKQPEQKKEISISYFKDAECYGINFDYTESDGVDSFCDLLGTINNFFTLVSYKPSEIKNVFITTTDDQKYQVIVRWMPIDSRNNEQRTTLSEFKIKDLANLIDKWIDFTSKADIASQQYFALQTMNRNTYEQMNLYTLIFCFEGFLSSYLNKINNACGTGISSSIHKKIRVLLNSTIDKVFKKRKYKKILKGIKEASINEYIENIKNTISYANELPFRKRIKLFISWHQEINNKIMTYDNFVGKLVTFRNTFAHSTDENINKIEDIDVYAYVVIVNYMLRTLLIKDVLGVKDADIPMEEI
jgi:hypothetical protein